MLAVLNECEISTTDPKSGTEQMVSIIITESTLNVIEPIHKWISDNAANSDILCIATQLLSNIIKVDKLSSIKLRINFYDENQDKSEQWTCTFETDSCADSTLNAISQPWEKLFGVLLE